MTIWCMVPEIWSVKERIFCHFGPFFDLYPPTNLKNQNFEKMKKIPGGTILLHMCNINEILWCMVPEIWSATDRNDNHMMYGSWDVKQDRQNFLSFSIVFCPFTPHPNKPENQNLKKWKKCLEISFYTCVTKIMITWWQKLRSHDGRRDRQSDI